MERLAFEIDEKGFVVETITVHSEKEYAEGNIVAILPPLGVSFYKKRWDGIHWVEGETEEEKAEREESAALEALKPTQEQLEQADFEIKSITLLKELEVI